MRAGDLYRAGPEGHVGVFVGDDRDQATLFLGPDGDFAKLADDGRIAGVVRVDGHGPVAKHGFRAGGRDRDIVAFFGESDVPVLVLFDVGIGFTPREGIFEVPHMAVDLDVLDFEVGNRGFKVGVPVHEALAAVNLAVVVEGDEDLEDGVVEFFVHCEGRPGPVHTGAKALVLFLDHAAGLFLPLPDLGDEGGAAHVGAGRLLGGGELFFDDKLRGDACVVEAGLPERVVALHPFPAGQDVHERVIEGVADVQKAGDVRRRQHDREGLCTAGTGTGLEGAGLFPSGVDAAFCGGGVECFVQCHDLPSFVRLAGV